MKSKITVLQLDGRTKQRIDFIGPQRSLAVLNKTLGDAFVRCINLENLNSVNEINGDSGRFTLNSGDQVMLSRTNFIALEISSQLAGEVEVLAMDEVNDRWVIKPDAGASPEHMSLLKALDQDDDPAMRHLLIGKVKAEQKKTKRRNDQRT